MRRLPSPPSITSRARPRSGGDTSLASDAALKDSISRLTDVLARLARIDSRGPDGSRRGEGPVKSDAALKHDVKAIGGEGPGLSDAALKDDVEVIGG